MPRTSRSSSFPSALSSSDLCGSLCVSFPDALRTLDVLAIHHSRQITVITSLSGDRSGTDSRQAVDDLTAGRVIEESKDQSGKSEREIGAESVSRTEDVRDGLQTQQVIDCAEDHAVSQEDHRAGSIRDGDQSRSSGQAGDSEPDYQDLCDRLTQAKHSVDEAQGQQTVFDAADCGEKVVRGDCQPPTACAPPPQPGSVGEGAQRPAELRVTETTCQPAPDSGNATPLAPVRIADNSPASSLISSSSIDSVNETGGSGTSRGIYLNGAFLEDVPLSRSGSQSDPHRLNRRPLLRTGRSRATTPRHIPSRVRISNA